MNIVDFLLARIDEDEMRAEYISEANPPENNRAPGGWGGWWFGHYMHYSRYTPERILAQCKAKRQIIEWHKNWPVLVEGHERPEYKLEQPFGGGGDIAIRITREIAWLTEQEYVKRFGTQPPTAPILKMLALEYADHKDYDERWRP